MRDAFSWSILWIEDGQRYTSYAMPFVACRTGMTWAPERRPQIEVLQEIGGGKNGKRGMRARRRNTTNDKPTNVEQILGYQQL